MKIAREPLTHELFTEILPLAQKCWEESTKNKGETCAYYGEREFQVEPDEKSYQEFSDNGRLVLITLRNEKLLGYVIGIVYSSLHHKKILCGFGDTIYIEPEYRKHTWAVIKRFESEMQALGIQIIGWPTHVNGPVYELLKAKGYVGDDIVMEKRIPCA